MSDSDRIINPTWALDFFATYSDSAVAHYAGLDSFVARYPGLMPGLYTATCFADSVYTNLILFTICESDLAAR